MERCLLVAVGCRQQVHTVEASLGQRDLLPFGSESIGLALACRSKVEVDAVVVDLSGQHLRRQCASLGIEAGLRLLARFCGHDAVIS